jgi:histidinol-phosphate aminotransferase
MGTPLSRRDLFRTAAGRFAPPDRSGAFVSARGWEHATATGDPYEPELPSRLNSRSLLNSPDAPIRLNSNENPVGPSAHAVEAMLASLPRAGRYTDKAPGSETAFIAAAAKANDVAAENVTWSPGSGELLAAAVRAFTSASRPLVTAWPSFETPHQTATKLGIPVKEVALDAGLALDVDKMIAASKGAGLVFFCNPNNPTGTVHGGKVVSDFIARVHADSPDTVILIDEAYHDYVTDPTYASMAPVAIANPNIIVTRTLSKAHGMAGVRVGYAIGQRATIRTLSRQRLGLALSVPGAAAGIASLEDAAHIADERTRNTAVREYAVRELKKLHVDIVPSNANFLFVNIGRAAAPFREACAKDNVLVGREFPPYENTHCRISLGTMPEMQRAMSVFAKLLGPAPQRNGGK